MKLSYTTRKTYVPMYEPGTVCYNVTVTDPKSRGFDIPWEDEYPENRRGWIETNPLCTDIYAPDKKTMDRRIAWFNDNYPEVYIGEVKSWTESPTTYDIKYNIPQSTVMDMLTNGTEETFEIFPMKLATKTSPEVVTCNTMKLHRDPDCVYDFKNVKKVTTHQTDIDPSWFTKDTPIALFHSPYADFYLEIDDPNKPIQYKACFIKDRCSFPTNFHKFEYCGLLRVK